MTASSLAYHFLKAYTLVVIILLGNTSCEHLPSKDILTFSQYAKTPHEQPYIVRLETEKGSLLYFGARHTYDYNDSQIQQIQNLWADFGPTLAFNEGGNPPGDLDLDTLVSRFGEPGVVRFFAHKDRIPVLSLEPDFRDEVAYLRQHYSDEQIKLFYILREVISHRKAKQETPVDSHIEAVISRLSNGRMAIHSKPYSLFELSDVSRQLLPALFDWHDVPHAWFDPLNTKGGPYLTELSRTLASLRDRHMANLILNALANGERVFAVVGASHVVMQEPFLRYSLRGRLKTDH